MSGSACEVDLVEWIKENGSRLGGAESFLHFPYMMMIFPFPMHNFVDHWQAFSRNCGGGEDNKRTTVGREMAGLIHSRDTAIRVDCCLEGGCCGTLGLTRH